MKVIETEVKDFFTPAQTEELRQLKAMCPFRIVWGRIDPLTKEFSAHTSYDRRAINKSLRAGYQVAIVQ